MLNSETYHSIYTKWHANR